MSKLSRPSYVSGNYKVNGKTKASTEKVGGTVYGNYNMNKNEKAAYDYAQKTLAEVLPQVNTFSDETLKGLQSQLNAYQNQGQKTINNIYTPLLNNLKNDIASRFGNVDNSMFLDKLSSIENSRADAVAQLAQNLILQRNELINNELSNRYNLINLLNGIQNQYNANALNAISSALSMSNSGNSQQQAANSSGLNLNSLLSLMTAL